MNSYSRDFNAKNKDKRRARDAKRAATTGGVRHGFRLDTKRDLFKKQNGICLCCFEPLKTPELSEVDHVVPLAKGGRDDMSNLLLAYAQCNQEKKEKTLRKHWEWRVKVGLDAENIGRKNGY